MKVLFGMALRQTTGFVESLMRLVGLDWTGPDFSTLSRRQKTLAVNIPYRGSQGPLHLLIPSHRCKQRLPGDGQHWIKVEGEGALLSYEFGGSCARLEPLPGTSFMTGGGGGRAVPLLAVMGRL